jgi:tetratricopeptide (TPR) repeat protein
MGGDYENARFYAEEALEKNPKEVTAQSALALIEAENYNWGEVKKWARKAIDYGSEDSNVYYAYCEALYKQGEVKAAHEYYNKAYELYRYNPRRSKFKEYAGCPFEVLSIHYGAIKETKTGTQFTIPIDGKLLSSQCYYVVFQLDVNYLRNEKATVGVKLFTNDKLKTGTPSRDGFTYTHDVIGSEPGKTIVKLSGWGNNSGDSWSVGQHRIELWYNGEKIAEDSFRIY